MGDTSVGLTGGVKRHRRPRRYITLKYLRNKDAPLALRQVFQSLYGKRATIAQLVGLMHRKGFGHQEARLLYNARLDIVEAMLRDGAHINAAGGHALFVAIVGRNKARAKFLLEHGARTPWKQMNDYDKKWVMWVRKTAGGLLRDPRDS